MHALAAAELVPVAVRIVATVPVVRGVISSGQSRSPPWSPPRARSPLGCAHGASRLSESAKCVSAEASPVEAAQAHAVGDAGHRGGRRGARQRAGGVHGSGAVDGAQLGQEGVVRRERIPE